jgi:hypothetical protein
VDLDAVRLQFDEFPENVGGAVEEGAGEHRRLDPTPGRVGFCLVTAPRLVQPVPRDVESVFGVVEQASRQRLDQKLLRLQGVGGNRVGLDPVAVVEHPLLSAEDSSRSLTRGRFAIRRPFESVDIIHRCNLCQKTCLLLARIVRMIGAAVSH